MTRFTQLGSLLPLSGLLWLAAPAVAQDVEFGAPQALQVSVSQDAALQGERGDPAPVDPKDLPDKRDEIKQLLEELKAHSKKRGDEDEACEPILEQLAEEYPKSGPKDRKSILGDVADLLTIKRKELAKDIPNERLSAFAAVMLGRMGEDAGPILAKHVGHKKLETKIKAHRAVVLALGATKWEDGIEVLITALDEDRPEVRAAAAEALANYKEMEQKHRKEIVEELIKVIVPIEETLEQNQQNPGAADIEQFQRDFDIMRAPIRTTLESMTETTNGTFRDWNAWWNDNKRKNWDEGRA